MLTYVQAEEPKSEESAEVAPSPTEEEKKEEESPSTEDTPQVESEISVSFLTAIVHLLGFLSTCGKVRHSRSTRPPYNICLVRTKASRALIFFISVYQLTQPRPNQNRPQLRLSHQ